MSKQGENFLVSFDSTTFHDFIAFLDILVSALFHDIPEFIRQPISSLVQLFFGLVFLTKVRILVTEVVEHLHEVVQDFLFAIQAIKVLKELALLFYVFLNMFLSVDTRYSHDHFDLVAVLIRKILPQLEQNCLEFVFNVIALEHMYSRQL